MHTGTNFNKKRIQEQILIKICIYSHKFNKNMHTGTHLIQICIQAHILIKICIYIIQAQILSKNAYTGTNFKQKNAYTGTTFKQKTHTSTNFNKKERIFRRSCINAHYCPSQNFNIIYMSIIFFTDRYSESQIYEYIDRHKFFDNSKETLISNSR